ncbi:unnamed protein product [Orchesella dallaii]|uniref:F-box domain-containing protein n=1 Tax=Orchesella dallaii TaxID=48710 RepID=A0ABP1RJ02_9HEXA
MAEAEETALVLETNLFSQAFPIIIKNTQIDIREFLSWRLVCKQWRNTIDHFLENLEYDGDLRMKLISIQKLQNFLAEMEFHPGNPFIGRRVFFYSYQRPKEQEDEYWSTALQLFSIKGEHIRCMTLCTDSTPLQFAQLIRAILSYLPNLKEIFFYYWHPDPTYLTRSQEEVYSELNSYIDSNPFPPLTSFQMFHFHTMIFPKPIQDAIISAYGPQLKTLGVRQWDQSYMPMLTNLEDFFLTVNDNSELESLLRSESPLETFMLILNMVEVDVALLFQVLETFGETLTSLELYFLAEASSSSSAEILNLPKLKKLEIRNTAFLSLNFLKSLGSSLKKLNLKSEEMTPETSVDVEDEIVKIRGFVGKMYESNIWEVLPKLQVLTVGNNECEVEDEKDIVAKIYTRQMFEYLNTMPEHTG